MRAHKRTLRRSVCGRRGASLLKPLRRAGGDPAGRETHVNTLGCLCDSGWLADWLLLLASQDGQGTASRGTARAHAQVQRRTLSPLMSTRNRGGEVGGRAPPLGVSGVLQLCALWW